MKRADVKDEERAEVFEEVAKVALAAGKAKWMLAWFESRAQGRRQAARAAQEAGQGLPPPPRLGPGLTDQPEESMATVIASPAMPALPTALSIMSWVATTAIVSPR